MSPATRSNNLAARMARWSAQHRKKAIFGWLALAVALFAISMASPMKKIVFETSGPGRVGAGGHDPVRGLQAACRRRGPDPERFADDERPRLQGGGAGSDRRRLEARRGGEGQVALRRRRTAGSISADKHSALVPMEIRGPSEDAADKVDAIVARVAEVQKANPELYVGSFGESTNKALQASFKDDLKRAGLFSIPLTLIILLVAFGALVAAGIPLLLGLTVGARHARPRRAHQPGVADVRLRLGDHPLDRARGRRRLHDVLFEARA